MRRSPEQHAPQEQESGLDYYIAQGRFDFGKLSPEQLSDLFTEYTTRFEELDTDVQTEILEQFLLLRTCTEEEARHFIKRMPWRSRADITEYLGKVLPGYYLELFHDNWDFLSYDLQDFFKKDFVENRPEYILMIAPFLDLERVYTRNPDDPKPKFYRSGRDINTNSRYRVPPRQEEKNPSKSYLEKYGNTFDIASTLMSLCLRKPQELGLSGIVHYYHNQNPYFLLPYMPELLEKGLYTKDEAKKLITAEGMTTRYASPIQTQFYYTPEEQKQYDEILRQVRKIKAGTIPEKSISHREGEWPENFKEKKMTLDGEAQKRGMHHIFDNFEAITATLLTPEDRLKTLDMFIERQVPLFFATRELNLAKEDVRRILMTAENRGDYIALLPDFEDIKILVDLGMEDMATRIIITQIKDSGPEYISQTILPNAENIASWLSEKNSTRIFKEITTLHPHAWFSRLDFVFKNQSTTFPSLLKEVREDGDVFMSSYLKILEAIRRAERDGINIGITLHELRETGRSLFEQNPNMIFWHAPRFRDVYTPEQQNEFITRHLWQDHNGTFLQEALRNFGRWKTHTPQDSEKEFLITDQYEGEFRKLFATRISLFTKALEEDPNLWHNAYMKIFSEEDRFTVLLPALKESNLGNIMYSSSTEILLDLATRPSALRNFITMLRAQNDVHVLAEFVHEIRALVAPPKKRLYGKPTAKKKEPELINNETRIFLRDSISALTRKIQDLIETNNYLAFDKRILGIEEPPAFYDYITQIIETQSEQYVRFHPYALDIFKSRISAPMYDTILRANLRAPAFLQDKYSGRLYDGDLISEETRQEINHMNPLTRFDFSSNKELKGDYYMLVLDIVRDNPFFALYQTQLEKIAKQELDRNGPRTIIEYYTPDDTFRALITRISLFAHVPEVVAQRDTILNLPSDKQEEFLNILELILLYAFDTEDNRAYQALTMLSEDMPKSKQMLLHIAQKFSGQLFDLNDISVSSDKESNPELTAGAIRASTLYYSTASGKDPATKRAFHTIAEHLLRGNFEQWRQWGNSNTQTSPAEQTVHLHTLQEQQLLPSNITLEQYHTWITTDSRSLEETLELSDQDIRTGIEQILSQAVADKHITSDELILQYHDAKERYDALFEPITELSARLEELRLKVQAAKSKKGIKDSAEKLNAEEEREYKNLQRTIADFRSEHAEDIARSEAILYLARTTMTTLRDVENRTLTIGSKQIPFQKALQTIESAFSSTHPDFVQDIKRIQTLLFTAFDQLFGGQRVSRSSLRVTDAFDFETYFKIGEEPVPSCQSYTSSSDLNEGLLSYVADPNVKIVQIYNDKNKIIARSVLRLLENSDGMPSLFLERIYSVNAHQKINEAIVAFAQTKAKEMGCTLYSHTTEGNTEADIDTEKSTAHVTDLYNHNSRSAYIYTDAGGGKMKKGIFTIRNAHAVI